MLCNLSSDLLPYAAGKAPRPVPREALPSLAWAGPSVTRFVEYLFPQNFLTAWRAARKPSTSAPMNAWSDIKRKRRMYQLEWEECLTGASLPGASGQPPRLCRQLPAARVVAGWVLLTLGLPGFLPAWGGGVKLTRKYRSGQVMVYSSKMHTTAVVHSDPPELQDFLPPLPTDFTVLEQNTVTIKAVHSDGSADLESHFDHFELQSNISPRAPESLRDSALRAQEEITRRMAGQKLMVHFDRNGRLLGFEGGEGLFEQLDLAYREPLRQAFRFFLEQQAGDALYPEQAVKPGKTWTRPLNVSASAAYPYNVEGENTLRYAGKTKVGGVKAAIIEFSFVNTLRPDPKALGKADPLAMLQSHGLGVDMHIEGQGKGRVLMALDDGRVLQSHATIHQTLRAKLQNPPPILFTKSHNMELEVQSDSQMDMDGAGK